MKVTNGNTSKRLVIDLEHGVVRQVYADEEGLNVFVRYSDAQDLGEERYIFDCPPLAVPEHIEIELVAHGYTDETANSEMPTGMTVPTSDNLLGFATTYAKRSTVVENECGVLSCLFDGNVAKFGCFSVSYKLVVKGSGQQTSRLDHALIYSNEVDDFYAACQQAYTRLKTQLDNLKSRQE